MIISDRDYWKDYLGNKESILEFKEAAAAYLGCTKITPVTNGTHAIEIALRALGLSRGDAVIVPDISFIATATALANVGLIPVYVDVDPEDFGLSVESLKNRYTEKVKAVVVVHFSGFVNRRIFEIKEFCKERGLPLIEDCAQSFPCSARGIMTGAIGDLGTFSFQSSKIINCGEGGMISATNDRLGAQCEAIADWGMSPSFTSRNFEIASSNFRLSGMQCYALTRQIMGINGIVTSRKKRCEELELACRQFGLVSALPKSKDLFSDCPFFFPIKTLKKINMIEPREETPMHRSKIVKSILKSFFPDLLEEYDILNPDALTKKYASLEVVAQTDFINISQTTNMDVKEVFSSYL